MLALLLESLCGSCAGYYHPLPDSTWLLCCMVWHFHMCSIWRLSQPICTDVSVAAALSAHPLCTAGAGIRCAGAP